jgi:hypothetical protein
MTGMTKVESAGLAAALTQPSLKVWTGASGIISAAHESSEGRLHGHTWEVKAWWLDGRDAVSARQTLAKYLSRFDHTLLPADLARGEALASDILIGLGCAVVDVSRPLEGIFARVELSPLPNAGVCAHE